MTSAAADANHPQPRLSLGLRAQILLGLALVTLFAVLSTGYLALWAAGSSFRVQRESTALAIASAAAATAAVLVDGAQPLSSADNRARLKNVVRGLAVEGEISQISFHAADRSVVASRPPRSPSDSDPTLLLALVSGVPQVYQYRSPAGDGQFELCAYAPVRVKHRVLGAVRVALPAPPPALVVLERSGWVLVALAVANAVLVLALGFLVLTQLVVRPLQTVEQATARVSAGDWEQSLRPSGPREVAALASAFNQMTASLASQREQLIRTEKLASVGQLAAGVAHEIGNPLAAILGYVDILRSDVLAAAGARLAPEERRDALDRVKAETQRIHRIIQDLLEYSRPSHEAARPCDPLKLLRATETLLEPQARFRGVTVVAAPGPAAAAAASADGAWPLVLVSPGRLQQVFVNLLINAADATQGQGTITVACDQSPEGRVRLHFCDTGPGVPPELRRKVFDPFFTTKPPGQGTGLGLAISRSIVESYGGALELAADDPKGATFLVTLPAA